MARCWDMTGPTGALRPRSSRGPCCASLASTCPGTKGVGDLGPREHATLFFGSKETVCFKDDRGLPFGQPTTLWTAVTDDPGEPGSVDSRGIFAFTAWAFVICWMGSPSLRAGQLEVTMAFGRLVEHGPGLAMLGCGSDGLDLVPVPRATDQLLHRQFFAARSRSFPIGALLDRCLWQSLTTRAMKRVPTVEKPLIPNALRRWVDETTTSLQEKLRWRGCQARCPSPSGFPAYRLQGSNHARRLARGSNQLERPT